MFEFKKDSSLAILFAHQILSGQIAWSEVPNYSNFREVVKADLISFGCTFTPDDKIVIPEEKKEK